MMPNVVSTGLASAPLLFVIERGERLGVCGTLGGLRTLQGAPVERLRLGKAASKKSLLQKDKEQARRRLLQRQAEIGRSCSEAARGRFGQI